MLCVPEVTSIFNHSSAHWDLSFLWSLNQNMSQNNPNNRSLLRCVLCPSVARHWAQSARELANIEISRREQIIIILLHGFNKKILKIIHGKVHLSLFHSYDGKSSYCENKLVIINI